MSRLPTPGGDDGTWGDVLNDFLKVAHNTDGSIKSSVLSGKEDTISAGATSQYWRGDKSWQTLNKSVVGLGNVDNTSDANKPISTATQTALDLKLDDSQLDTDTTLAADSDSKIASQHATKTYVDSAVSALSDYSNLLGGVSGSATALTRWKAGHGLRGSNLNGAIGTTNGTSITIADAGLFIDTTKRVIQIDSEQMLVTAGQTTTSLTVIRGVNGTTAATHSDGAEVFISKVRQVVHIGDSIVQGTNLGADPFSNRAGRILGARMGGYLGGAQPAWRLSNIGNTAPDWTFTGSFTPLGFYNTASTSPWAGIQFIAGSGNALIWTRPAGMDVKSIDFFWVDEGTTSAQWSYSLDGGSGWVDNPIASTYAGTYELRRTRISCNNPTTFRVRAANSSGTAKSFAISYIAMNAWKSAPTFGTTEGLQWHNLGWDGQKLRTAINSRTVTDAVSNGTTTVTSATASFVTGDAGSTIKVNDTWTTVVTRDSATQITTADIVPAASGGTLTIISGDHTSDWKQTFDGMAGSMVPDLFIIGFVNDMAGSTNGDGNPDAYKNMLEYMYNKLSPYADVVFTNSYELGSVDTSLQAQYRTKVKELAAAKDAICIDYYDAYAAAGYTGYSVVNAAGFMGDTAHPSAKGHRWLGNYLARVLDIYS